jgi:N-acetylglucosaminyldiphosphoundecaprenol N-acetyl-beta-D-mannosaminyltransferase
VEHQIWPEPAPPEPYTGPDRRKRMPVLGMRLRDFDVAQAADYMLSTQRTQQEGVGLFVTPNIQHIALARDDVEFATAMKSAQIIVADGFPVYRFAKARGPVSARADHRARGDRGHVQPPGAAGGPSRLFRGGQRGNCDKGRGMDGAGLSGACRPYPCPALRF